MNRGNRRLLVYRVRDIPAHVGPHQLREALSNALVPGAPADAIYVRSLCTSLSPLSATGEQEALVEIDRNKYPSVHVLQDGKTDHLQTSLATLTQDSHLRGWTVLHEPEGDIETCMVFVSGLAAHPFHSWREKDSSYMWPQDYVSKKAPSTLSLSYGHELKLFKSPSISTYKETAQGLMHGLKQHLTRFFDKPCAFAAYSLGGLIVKQCLVNMAKGSQDTRRLLVAVRVLVFFGVPHKGLKNEDFVQVSEGWPNEQGIRELGEGSNHLLELDEAFKEVCKKYRISVVSAYELHETSTVQTVAGDVSRDGDPVLRVSPESAKHSLSGSAFEVPIEACHTLLAKFSRGSNDLDTIMRMVVTAAAKSRETWRDGPSIPDRNHPCEGRADQINAIRSRLGVADSSYYDIQKEDVTVMVICGMNAIGKTFLAEHYFKCHSHLYEWKHTVCAATSGKFSASLLHDQKYKRFYSQYHGATAFPPELAKHEESLLAFLDEKSSKPWLLLLDDAPSESESYLEQLLERLRSLRGGHVIITTRRVNNFLMDEPLELGPLDHDASRKVLLRGKESNSETPVIDDLLNVLCGHPLALRLMSAYKSSYQKPWADALQEITRRLAHKKVGSEVGPLAFNKKFDELFSETWLMAFNAIGAVNSQADELLMLWGCFEKAGFSYELLRHYKADSSSPAANNQNEDSFSDAMLVLLDFGLVSPRAQGVYDIHQLPHAACRKSALADGKVAWKALKCVGAALPSYIHPDYCATGASLLPHALAALELHQGFVECPSMTETEAEAQASCLLGLLRVFRTQDNFKEAQLISEYVDKTLSHLPGPRGALPRLNLRSEIGLLALDQEQNERGVELFEGVYEDMGHLLGRSDEQTLLAGSTLASAYSRIGRLSCSESMLQKLTQECAGKPELVDIEHRCRTSLTGILWNHHKDEAGVKVYEDGQDLLTFTKEKFPGDTPRIAGDACNLATVCLGLDRLEESKQLFDQYLPDLERSMPNALEVCRMKGSYALVHDYLGDYQRAEELYLESLAGFERHTQGTDKKAWASMKLNLSTLYLDQGNRDAAERLYREAEPMLKDGVPENIRERFSQDDAVGPD